MTIVSFLGYLTVSLNASYRLPFYIFAIFFSLALEDIRRSASYGRLAGHFAQANHFFYIILIPFYLKAQIFSDHVKK